MDHEKRLALEQVVTLQLAAAFHNKERGKPPGRFGIRLVNQTRGGTGAGRAIRWKLRKVGAGVLRNPRRSQLLLSSGHPYQRLFGQVAQALSGS
jgi:hypothetical protein